MDAYAPEVERMMRAAVRLAQGERSTAVCGHRGREAGARWDRVHRRCLGLRSQDHPAGAGGTGRARTTWTRVAPKKGGGRKRLIEIDPALEANFLKVLEDHTAGDPMRPEVKWTNLSRRQIAKRIDGAGDSGQSRRRLPVAHASTGTAGGRR